MTKITIEQAVQISDGMYRDIHIDVNKEGCIIRLTTGFQEDTNNLTTRLVTWEQLDDVEHLSTLFDDELVKVFKVIIVMLGKVIDSRLLYMGLLQ